MGIRVFSIFLIISNFSSLAFASELIEFPQEELAQESVLPIFDKVEVVKNRRVPTSEKFEVGIGFGLNLTEALYKNTEFNLNGTYNFTNIHAVHVSTFILQQGLSDMGQDLANGKGLLPGQKFDASLGPSLENLLNIDYQITTYYGKISLTKNYVINLSLYGLLGLTNATFSDSSSIGLNFGVGQKFYLNSWLGLRVDLLMAVFQGPDITTAPSGITSPVSSGDLKDTTFFTTFFNFGLVAIL